MRHLIHTIFLASVLWCCNLHAQNMTPMNEWQYPYETHVLAIDDSLFIAYVDEGQGSNTLLFLHGLGSNLKAWQKNIDVLKKSHRCIALDLPGYGKSSQAAYPFDMSFFAQAVQSFITRLHLQDVTLVGHSMGAQVAMHVVLNREVDVANLVLIAPAGFETFTSEQSEWIQTIYTSPVIQASSESQIIQNFHLNFHAFPEDAQFMIDDRLHMKEDESSYSFYCDMIPRCVTGMLEEPVFDKLNEIGVPTLVLFGKNDMLIPNRNLNPTLTTSDVANAGMKEIPDCQLELIPNAGHFVQWEQYERVNAELAAFLR